MLTSIYKTVRYPVMGLLLLWLTFYSIPVHLPDDPLSTVVFDREGRLVGARIAADGQWRFPATSEVPEKFEKALMAFEDGRFYAHPGVDPVAMLRAGWQNLGEGRVVSGGSTISMQVIRISRKGRDRSIFEKVIEIAMAISLEMKYSKDEILGIYASNAPFGGNVVGLQAAAWRYFRRPPGQLSWAESALLAVLPNAPALIHPGRNRGLLKAKRDRLLDKLQENGDIDAETCKLAKKEAIPEAPMPLPKAAPQLVTRIYNEKPGQQVKTSIDLDKQERVNRLSETWAKTLAYNHIYNLSVVVVDIESNQVLVYVGNTPGLDKEHSPDVDIIMSPRSTGSILKPLLYAAMLDDGMLLPDMLVEDVPTQINGYSPENFDKQFDGAVPASEALTRSLNIPAVRMLQDYGLVRFHHLLRRLGISTMDKPTDHYGLSLIIGGGEASLWELCGVYASMARVLRGYEEHPLLYRPKAIEAPEIYLGDKKVDFGSLTRHKVLSSGSIWLTFKAMLELKRPDYEQGWQYFSSTDRIAWKTGTSWGYRDAWAIGVNGQYAVGVWAGNADGEGRPGLVGVKAAAPLMFSVFELFRAEDYFTEPLDELLPLAICRQSGHKASGICPDVDTAYVCEAGIRSAQCPYHRLAHLAPDEDLRVNSTCAKPQEMRHEAWFVLPTVQAWYYKNKHPWYKALPPYKEGCGGQRGGSPIELIYPREAKKIYIPRQGDGKPGEVVFEAAHERRGVKLYWHLDDKYLATTDFKHKIAFIADYGPHVITIVDENGNSLKRAFELSSENNY